MSYTNFNHYTLCSLVRCLKINFTVIFLMSQLKKKSDNTNEIKYFWLHNDLMLLILLILNYLEIFAVICRLKWRQTFYQPRKDVCSELKQWCYSLIGVVHTVFYHNFSFFSQQCMTVYYEISDIISWIVFAQHWEET